MKSTEIIRVVDSLNNIGKAIVVVGLAAISGWTYIVTAGAIGQGWGTIAFLALILWDWD